MNRIIGILRDNLGGMVSRDFVIHFYNRCRELFGTNSDYTGLGDIVGFMGPFLLGAALFLLIALIMALLGGRRRSAAVSGMIWSIIAAAGGLMFKFSWIDASGTYFRSEAISMVNGIVMGVCAAAALLFLICFLEACSCRSVRYDEDSEDGSSDITSEEIADLKQRMHDLEEQFRHQTERFDSFDRDMEDLKNQAIAAAQASVQQKISLVLRQEAAEKAEAAIRTEPEIPAEEEPASDPQPRYDFEETPADEAASKQAAAPEAPASEPEKEPEPIPLWEDGKKVPSLILPIIALVLTLTVFTSAHSSALAVIRTVLLVLAFIFAVSARNKRSKAKSTLVMLLSIAAAIMAVVSLGMNSSAIQVRASSAAPGAAALISSVLMFIFSRRLKSVNKEYWQRKEREKQARLRREAEKRAARQQADARTAQSHAKPTGGRIDTGALYTADLGRSVILSIVTLGVYGLIWEWHMVKNMRIIEGQDPENIKKEFLLLILVPFYFIFWYYKHSQSYVQACRDDGYDMEDRSTIFLILAIFGLSIVDLCLMQEDCNKLADGTCRRISDNRASAPQASSEDSAALLEKLARLHDQGILSDQEFADKKKELLDRI